MDLQSVKTHLESLTVSDAKRFITDLVAFGNELEERGKKEAALAIKKRAEEAGLTVEELFKFLGGDVTKKSKKEGGKRTSTIYELTYKGERYTVVNVGKSDSKTVELLAALKLATKKELFALLNDNKAGTLGITEVNKL
ncbi:hypothetical protein ABQ333_26835 [Serratia fonticola]|uniref:hypothetical protein n=1 Tax=Serratia fonticola TaxID=47917 RepID=UPI003AB10521